MTFSYTCLSHTLLFYFFFPIVALHLCYTTHGIYSRRLLTSEHKAICSTRPSTTLTTLTIVSLVFIVPVLFVLSLLRGTESTSLGVTGVLTASTVRWVTSLILVFIFLIGSICLRKSPRGNVDYSELFYGYVFMCLAWFFIGLSSSILAFLLALEVITLLLFIIMCNVSLSHNAGFKEIQRNWVAVNFGERTQHAMISTLLSFIWVMGFATIFFLWAVGFMFPLFASVDFMYVTLASSSWQSTHTVGIFNFLALSGNWLGLALLFKLLLQPFQTFLIVFYRQLPPLVLLNYFQFYYIFVLLFVFFYIVTPYGFITLGWHSMVIAYTSALLVTLLLGSETLRDLGTVLAYSTFVNISFFLVVGGYHAI